MGEGIEDTSEVMGKGKGESEAIIVCLEISYQIAPSRTIFG